MSNINVLIIGTGPIGIEYASILLSLGVPFSILRRPCSTSKLPEILKEVNTFYENLENFDFSPYSHVINAVNLENQGSVNLYLLTKKISILSEKPGFIFSSQFKRAVELCTEYGSKFYVAYNRRFYPSIAKAKSLIANDGGLISFLFDFTEWEKSIIETNLPNKLNERWGLLNSLHIIDTCFYINIFKFIRVLNLQNVILLSRVI